MGWKQEKKKKSKPTKNYRKQQHLSFLNTQNEHVPYYCFFKSDTQKQTDNLVNYLIHIKIATFVLPGYQISTLHRKKSIRKKNTIIFLECIWFATKPLLKKSDMLSTKMLHISMWIKAFKIISIIFNRITYFSSTKNIHYFKKPVQ